MLGVGALAALVLCSFSGSCLDQSAHDRVVYWGQANWVFKSKISNTIFGTDVFLSCVYVIYVYTVLKMRMTQEFNKVMPQLPEFCRRLLGVRKKPSLAATGT